MKYTNIIQVPEIVNNELKNETKDFEIKEPELYSLPQFDNIETNDANEVNLFSFEIIEKRRVGGERKPYLPNFRNIYFFIEKDK